MATVYLAQDLKHHRPVALKVLRPELAATLGPERFLREIEIAAQLHHPHILPLCDSGEAGQPRPEDGLVTSGPFVLAGTARWLRVPRRFEICPSSANRVREPVRIRHAWSRTK